MQTRTAKVLEGGRLILPADFRRAMKLEAGDTVVLEFDDAAREVRVRSPADHIAWVQQTMRRYVPEGVSLADELIADRRAEALRE